MFLRCPLLSRLALLPTLLAALLLAGCEREGGQGGFRPVQSTFVSCPDLAGTYAVANREATEVSPDRSDRWQQLVIEGAPGGPLTLTWKRAPVTMAELTLGDRPGDRWLPGDRDMSDAAYVQAHVRVVEPLPTTAVTRLSRGQYQCSHGLLSTRRNVLARDESGGLLTEDTPRPIVDAGFDLPCWDGCKTIALAWHVDHHWRRWERWAGVPLPSSLPGDGAFELPEAASARLAAGACTADNRWAPFLAPLLPPAVQLDVLRVDDGIAFVRLSAPSADDLALALRRFDGSGEFTHVKVLAFTGRTTAPQAVTAMLDLGAPLAAAAAVDVEEAVRALPKPTRNTKYAEETPVPRPVDGGFEMRWRSRDIFAGRDLVDAMNRTPGFADAQWTRPAEGTDRQLQLVRFRREATPRGDASRRPGMTGGC